MRCLADPACPYPAMKGVCRYHAQTQSIPSFLLGDALDLDDIYTDKWPWPTLSVVRSINRDPESFRFVLPVREVVAPKLPRMRAMRQCPTCRVLFRPTHDAQKFDAPKCSRKAYRVRNYLHLDQRACANPACARMFTPKRTVDRCCCKACGLAYLLIQKRERTRGKDVENANRSDAHTYPVGPWMRGKEASADGRHTAN